MAKYIAKPIEVDAFVIVGVSSPLSDGARWLDLEGAPLSLASTDMMARMTPKVGDYWVVQSDGYVYLNPKAVFERKYSPKVRPLPTIEELDKILNSEEKGHLEVLGDGSVVARGPDASK